MTDQPDQTPPKPEMLEISRASAEALKDLIVRLRLEAVAPALELLSGLKPAKEKEPTAKRTVRELAEPVFNFQDVTKEIKGKDRFCVSLPPVYDDDGDMRQQPYHLEAEIMPGGRVHFEHDDLGCKEIIEAMLQAAYEVQKVQNEYFQRRADAEYARRVASGEENS